MHLSNQQEEISIVQFPYVATTQMHLPDACVTWAGTMLETFLNGTKDIASFTLLLCVCVGTAKMMSLMKAK